MRRYPRAASARGLPSRATRARPCSAVWKRGEIRSGPSALRPHHPKGTSSFSSSSLSPFCLPSRPGNNSIIPTFRRAQRHALSPGRHDPGVTHDPHAGVREAGRRRGREVKRSASLPSGKGGGRLRGLLSPRAVDTIWNIMPSSITPTVHRRKTRTRNLSRRFLPLPERRRSRCRLPAAPSASPAATCAPRASPLASTAGSARDVFGPFSSRAQRARFMPESAKSPRREARVTTPSP